MKVLDPVIFPRWVILIYMVKLNVKKGYYIYKAVSNTHMYISFKREKHMDHKTYGILSSSVIHYIVLVKLKLYTPVFLQFQWTRDF